MKITLLRYVLMVDAALLLLLGGLLIAAPNALEAVFHFQGLPAGVSYLIGLWGCALLTLGMGYVVAATQPLRHLVWVQVGIARGSLECVLGLVYWARGVVNWQQAAFGILGAALMTLAYLACYPRPRLQPQPTT